MPDDAKPDASSSARSASGGEGSSHGQSPDRRRAAAPRRRARGDRGEERGSEATLETLQARIEDLQSVNERLESLKEALEASNEELRAENADLRRRSETLSRSEAGMNAVLHGLDVAILALDDELRIRSFTRPIRDLIHVLDEDVGRPLGDLACRLRDVDLEATAREVASSLEPLDREVRGVDGRYLMRIRPLRLPGREIDGVLIAFFSEEALKALRDSRADASLRTHATGLSELMPQPILMLDERFRVVGANQPFHRMFHTTPASTVGRSVFDLGDGRWDVPELRRFLEELPPGTERPSTCTARLEVAGVGRRSLVLCARSLPDDRGEKALAICLGVEDVFGASGD